MVTDVDECAVRVRLSSVPKLLVLRGILIVLMLFSANIALGQTQLAHASAMDPTMVEQRDLDGDGQPDLTILQGAFMTGNDVIQVYDTNADMTWATQWQQATDFENDIWVFDAGADGEPELILVFGSLSGRQVADVYTDCDGDDHVSYQITSARLDVAECTSWSVSVAADSTWYQDNGEINLNLTFWHDGYTDESFEQIPMVFRPYFTAKPDGEIDDILEIVDANRDGVPEYALRRTLTLFPTQYNRSTSGLRVNAGSHHPAPYSDQLFWPLLVTVEEAPRYNYFDHVPAIFVDWEHSEVEATLEGYPIEVGYHVNSWGAWEKNTVNQVSFENPQAYYDLAADRDGWPELHIRMEYYGPSDPFWRVVPSRRARNDIRYSWNQDNSPDLVWDYKVALAGDHLVDSVVQFADFGIKTIPYEALPSWIVEQAWAWGTLVATEGGGYRSSEGIYEWGATYDFQTDVRDSDTRVPGSAIALNQYLTGASVEPPDRFFESIRAPWRGEFAYLEDRPFLYLSPVDRKLHLRHALKGIWNTGDESEIRVADRDGDAYVDEWLFSRGGILQRQLNLAPDHLILSDSTAERAEVKRTKVGPVLFETLPPHDHNSWQRLGAQLEAYLPSFAPDDFAAMADQFDGPATRIEGATLRSYRPQGDGFRFVLDARPGFRILSDPEGWASKLTAPGAYAISFDGMAWDARPATPAAPRAGELLVGEPGQPLRALEWTSIEILLQNDGLEDVLELPVYAVLTGPAGQQEVLTTTVSLLPAEGSQHVAWDWAPPAAGAWQARIEAGSEPRSGSGVPREVLVTADLYVQPQSVPSAEWLLSLGSPSPPAILGMLGGLALLASATVAVWAATRNLESQV